MKYKEGVFKISGVKHKYLVLQEERGLFIDGAYETPWNLSMFFNLPHVVWSIDKNTRYKDVKDEGLLIDGGLLQW